MTDSAPAAVVDVVPMGRVCQRVVTVSREGWPSAAGPVIGRFIGPDGREHRRWAMVAGENELAVRFAPTQPGTWRYELCHTRDRQATIPADRLFAGTFECITHQDASALDRHGRVTVARGGRHLCHADGTPFFFLADTAWNGALLATDADWREYLADRRAKGFSAIQFNLLPWAAAPTDEAGERALVPDEEWGDWRINHKFFDRMDQRVESVNDAGLLAVPVLVWAANFGKSGRLNPGVTLSASELERLVRYLVIRYGDHHVLWILAGDGRYGGLRALRWQRVGGNVFDDPLLPRAPVALHPMGMTWPYRRFRDAPWLDVLGYQSGHANDTRALQWFLKGPPATTWPDDPRPVINLEPCYEGIRNWGAKAPFTNVEVRRALYASLLNAPTAGVTYGAHGVWSWETEPREPLNHPGVGVAQPWRKAMAFPGSHDVRVLASLFQSIRWSTLRPAPHLLRRQPGDTDLARFVCAAADDDRKLAIAYLPRGGRVEFDPPEIDRMLPHWFDPRTGERHQTSGSDGQFTAPTEDDWLLVLQKAP